MQSKVEGAIAHLGKVPPSSAGAERRQSVDCSEKYCYSLKYGVNII